MERSLGFVLLVVLGSLLGSAQAPAPATTGKSPKELIEDLWKRATEGEFLGPEGRRRYSGFFVRTSVPSEKNVVRVVSNHWGVGPTSTSNAHAEVDVWYTDEGTVDSELRYTPAPPSPFFKTAWTFHLALAPTYAVMYQSDGKVITGKEEKETGLVAWQIADPQGPPFTTVNTAIRYVLEVRGKAKDPVVRKNADETLSKLLRVD